MLNLCKKYQVPVVMDSDAHFDLLIGEFDLARKLEKEMKEAAKALDFERAAELRDMIIELRGE